MANDTKNAYKEVVGEKNSAKGMKWDSGKLDWSLLPWDVIETLVLRLDVGKRKYSAWNWCKLDDAKNRYEAAFMRHWVEYKKGNRFDLDPNFDGTESTHLQAAFWNLMCLVWFELRDIENQNIKKEKK